MAALVYKFVVLGKPIQVLTMLISYLCVVNGKCCHWWEMYLVLINTGGQRVKDTLDFEILSTVGVFTVGCYPKLKLFEH